MKKILIATTNPGKITEITIGLQELNSRGIDLLTLNDVKVGEGKPEENGATFKENAEIKARFYAGLTGLPCLSDDGGLIIPYLNNEPGVKSRRWLGYEAGDQELIDYTLKRLHGVKKPDRKAYLEACVYFYNPQTNESVYETESIFGSISDTPSKKRVPGFPYRALLVIEEFNKFYDDLNIYEHSQVNHRLKALKRLTKRIENLI